MYTLPIQYDIEMHNSYTHKHNLINDNGGGAGTKMTKGIRSQVCHLKGLGLLNRLGATDASRHLKQPHSFFVTVRFWPH